MNKILFCLLISTALSVTVPAYAQSAAEPAATTQPAPMDAAIADLQQKWASIKYQMPDEEKQEKAMGELADEAAKVSKNYPDKAEPLIWQAIIISTQAGIEGGLSALGECKQARDLLLQAEKIDPNALNGSVYTSLGSLYYKVPRWPIGFGDNKKAREYLEKALAINPDGIDPNFFYGDFLYEMGDYAKSKTVLEHALQAAPRPNRELADKGRKEEIRDLLQKVNKKL